MQFEPSQAAEILAPVVIEDALSNIPVFGPAKADFEVILNKTVQLRGRNNQTVVDLQASHAELPRAFTEGSTVAAKLRALRNYSKEHLQPGRKGNTGQTNHPYEATVRTKMQQPMSTTNQELHEMHLSSIVGAKGFPLEAQRVIDHTMLLRAKEKYLFDCEANRRVVSDDPWLRDVWAWIAGTSLSPSEPWGMLLTRHV